MYLDIIDKLKRGEARMVRVNFKYMVDESGNWIDSYAVLPVEGASEDDIKHLVSEIIRVRNKKIVCREFSYRIVSIEKE